MRELEFLPEWYRTVRRRRTWVLAQAWCTAALLLVLVIWAGVARFRAVRSQRELVALNEEVAVVQKQVDQVRSLQLEQRSWSERGEVLEKLGLSVESTRLLSTIAKATPESIALNNFVLQTEEKAEVPKTMSAARATKDRNPTMQRRLLVKLMGIAPSNAEVFDMVTRLTTYPFFEEVTPSTKEADFQGRLVTEFEVTFAIDLNAAVGN